MCREQALEETGVEFDGVRDPAKLHEQAARFIVLLVEAGLRAVRGVAKVPSLQCCCLV